MHVFVAMVQEPLECWICRDVTSTEPLVQPCRCRGTMGGVHASCVEAWVQVRVAMQEVPRCPVCHAEYGGDERRPGFKVLARHMVRGFWHHLASIVMEGCRFVFLGILLVQYCAMAGDGRACRSPAVSGLFGPHTRGLVGAALGILLLHKLLVFSASLPPNRAPPQHRFLLRFYTQDLWSIVKHFAELLAVVQLLGIRCACGDLPIKYFAPIALAALSPLVQVAQWYPVGSFLREGLMFLGLFIYGPIFVCLQVLKLARRHARRLTNPLDGPAHLAASLMTVVLCLACRSRRPVKMLLLAHSSVLALGLMERVIVRKLRWRPGDAWWCALFTSIQVFSLVLERRWFTMALLLIALRSLKRAADAPRPHPDAMFQGPLWWCMLLVTTEAAGLWVRGARGGAIDSSGIVWASSSWLSLLAALTCVVNWGSCRGQYERWQRRNATFVLCAPAVETGIREAGSAAAGTVEELV